MQFVGWVVPRSVSRAKPNREPNGLRMQIFKGPQHVGTWPTCFPSLRSPNPDRLNLRVHLSIEAAAETDIPVI